MDEALHTLKKHNISQDSLDTRPSISQPIWVESKNIEDEKELISYVQWQCIVLEANLRS